MREYQSQTAGFGRPTSFTVSVDGQVIGKTTHFYVDGCTGSGPKGALLPHELTHLLQGRKGGSIAGSKTLKLGRIEGAGGSGTVSRDADMRLGTSRGKRISITTDRFGGLECTSQGASIDVHQQEWTIVYESIQRVL